MQEQTKDSPPLGWKRRSYEQFGDISNGDNVQLLPALLGLLNPWDQFGLEQNLLSKVVVGDGSFPACSFMLTRDSVGAVSYIAIIH